MKLEDPIYGVLIAGLFVVICTAFIVSSDNNYGPTSNITSEITPLNKLNETISLSEDIANQTRSGKVTAVDFFVSAIQETLTAMKLAFSSVTSVGAILDFVARKMGLSRIFVVVIITLITIAMTFALIKIINRGGG